MKQDILHNLWQTPLPRAVELMSLEEMMARIEAIRLEEARPICTSCGSTANPRLLETKWCPICKTMKMRSAFSPAPSRWSGRYDYCRPCANERRLAAKRRRIIRLMRRAP